MYFVSHGGAAFPNLVVVLQGDGVRVDLTAATFISKAGITSSTFKTIPDVPFSSFELYLPEGPYSALTANGSLCKSKARDADGVHGAERSDDPSGDPDRRHRLPESRQGEEGAKGAAGATGQQRAGGSVMRRASGRTLGVLAITLGVLACSAVPALAAQETPELTVEDATFAVAAPSMEARLHGVVNPNGVGEAGTYQFLYKESKTGVCTGGSTAPASPGPVLSGGREEPFETITGLTPGTEYAVCLRVENNAKSESKTSPVVTFTTPVKPEKPETLTPAKEITGTTAKLEGILNPVKAGEAGTYEFTYQRSASECNREFGAPEPAGTMTGASPQAVSVTVTNLEPNQQYTFCLVAINKAGEPTAGNPVSFKTEPTPPNVGIEGFFGVTPFAASVFAEVNPENQTTSCVFEYGLVAGEYKAPCEPPTLEGGGPVGVNFALTKLTPATKYHYRVAVKNATGEKKGPDETFETLALEKPTLSGEHTGLITAPKTTIEGQLDPNYQPITGCEVQYALQGAGFGAPESVGCQPNNPPENTFGEGANNVALIATLTGLHPGSSYEYRILASNNSGTTVGAVQPFLVPPRPLVTVGEAQSITRTTATLPGTVNPEGLETFYYYQYGTTTAYGGNAPSIQGVAAGSGSSAVAAPIGISGLEPATTYHYRLVATNADGTTYSSPDKTFTTAPPTPPTASTGEASNITLTTATVTGTINPEGLETSYELDLGTDPTYGTSIYGEVGSASTPTEITVNLQDLAPGSTYHYRFVAINSDGRSQGGVDRTFTTPAYNNPIVQPFTLPLITAPAIAFPTETKNTAKPTIKKHAKPKHKKPKHKKPKHKQKGKKKKA